MTQIIYILADGVARTVEAADGETVMGTAVRNNIRGIDADCGGCCSCATCHVYVSDQWVDRLSPPDEVEEALLDGVAAGRRPGSRLSCQIRVTSNLAGLTVYLPHRQS